MPESIRELFHVYYRSVPQLLAKELFGQEMTRFTSETHCTVAEEDLELKAMTINKGKVVPSRFAGDFRELAEA